MQMESDGWIQGVLRVHISGDEEMRETYVKMCPDLGLKQTDKGR